MKDAELRVFEALLRNFVNACPETNQAPPEVLADYLAINADPLPALLRLRGQRLKLQAHCGIVALLRRLYLLVLTTFAFRLSRERKWLSKDLSDALTLHTGLILLFAIFHALVQIAYDWRYRLPTMPSLIFIASTALSLLGRAYRGRAGPGI